MSETGLIFQQIAKVMADLTAVGKDRKNTQQNYSFRGIDDVYNEIHTHLAKHGVFTVPTVLDDRSEERATKAGSQLLYRILKIQYRFYAADGSFVDAVVIGEGMDSGDKATNKAMAVAHKYALVQVFAIPTADSKDPEEQSHDTRRSYSGPPQGYIPDDIPPEAMPVPLKAPAKVPEEKYDPKNERHVDRLVKKLEEMQVPMRYWDDVGAEIKGKLMSQASLQAAIKKVVK